MDPDIEKLDVQIKSEVNYDELGYYVPEEAIVVSSEAYEEVVVSEDMITHHKIEPEDTYYDSNYSFNSPSKDTYYDSAYDENNNSNNYLYQQIREPQQNYTLKAKQLELMRVKKMGGKQKLVSGRADTWSHCRDDAFNIDDVTVMGYRGKPNKPRKRSFAHRLQWNNRDMEEAMRGVGLQNMTIRGAAKKYNVPYSTLKDRIKGRVTHGTKPGVKTVLSPEEETQLVWFIHQMEQCGFSLLCTDVRQKASELLSMTQRNCKNPVVPGHNWLSGFLKRHPGLEIKRSSSRLHPPSSNKIKLMLKKFYDILANAYNKLSNDNEQLTPDRVYVMNVIQPQALSKATIVTTACANGSLLPPYVIGPFSRQTLYHMQQTYPMAYFVTSTDLDSRDKILLPWFRDYLISKIRGTNPHHNNILLLDQPVGYISINLAELAIESGIKIVSIPPQLSKLLQPLDATFYASFQNATQKQLTWVGNNQEGGSPDDGVKIAHVLKRVFDRASIFAVEIMSNFKQTGIFPHNSRAIPVERLATLQPHSSTSSAFGSIIDEEDEEDGGSYNSNIVTSRDAIVTVKNGVDEDLFNNSNPNNLFLRQEVVSLEDHGLHLLSELSSRTAHTTNNGNEHKYKGDKAYQRYEKKKYLTEEVVYSYDGSYGNADDVQYVAHEVSLENKEHYDDEDEEEEEEEEEEEDEDEGVSSKRPKRSAAGRSERLMKRIMEDKDEDEDDEVVRKYRKKAKFLLDDNYKYHKRHHEDEEDDDEEEEDDDDELYDDGQCCRSRPIDCKYQVHRSVEGGEFYDVVDRFSDGWKEHDNSFKSTPSKYEEKNSYFNNNTPVKSIINNNFIRQQPQQHVRHFSVTRGRLKNNAVRQQKIINKHNNDHNNSDINLAIQSILPKNTNTNNNKFIVKGEEEEGRNGGLMVDSPLRNVKLAEVKGTRLLYSLKYQQSSSHEKVVVGDNCHETPMRILLNNNTSSTSLLSPPSSLSSSIVVSSSASSPSLSSQPHSKLILSPRNTGHNHLKKTIVIQSSLNNNKNNNSSNNINNFNNDVANSISTSKTTTTTTTTNLLTKTFKSPAQRIIIKPQNNNAINVSGDVKETEEGMVEIGGKAYDWSRKVRATKHIMVSGVEVELVRNVTLRDALSRGDLKDNNLEII